MVDVRGNIFSVAAEGRWGGLLLGGGVYLPQKKFSKWWAMLPPGHYRLSEISLVEWRRLALEVFGGGVIFELCRSTSFIAKNAGRTAKFSSVRAIGRARSARYAAPRSWRRNFRRSPQRTRAALRVGRARRAAVDVAPGAGAITDCK